MSATTCNLSPSLWVVTLALVCSACGGAAGLVDGRYSDSEVRYRVQAPGASWSAVEVDGDDDLAWVSDEGAIQISSTCSPAQDIPLTSLTAHLLIGFTEREYVEQSLIELSGREALRTHVQAKLDGVPRELLLVVVKRNACVYDLAYVASPAHFERGVRSFEQVLASFEVEAP